MRHRSKTNSQHEEDPALIAHLKATVFYDELLAYFPIAEIGNVKVPGWSQTLSMHGTDARDPHHIWGGTKGRFDRLWNVVMVCRPCHDFCETWKTDGRVIAMRRKLDAGLWDECDAYRCLGMKPLGWISGVRCEHNFAERIRVEIVRQVEAGELP